MQESWLNKMDRNKFKFSVDILMFLDFLILAISGFILMKVYPAGEKSGMAGVRFLLDRFAWLKVHDVTSILIMILLIIHLILNWNWIKGMFKQLFKKKDLVVENE